MIKKRHDNKSLSLMLDFMFCRRLQMVLNYAIISQYTAKIFINDANGYKWKALMIGIQFNECDITLKPYTVLQF